MILVGYLVWIAVVVGLAAFMFLRRRPQPAMADEPTSGFRRRAVPDAFRVVLWLLASVPAWFGMQLVLFAMGVIGR